MNTEHYPAVKKEVTTKERGNFIVGDDSNMYTCYEHLLFTRPQLFARVYAFFTNTVKLTSIAVSSTI
jgi:hypothetical protein